MSRSLLTPAILVVLCLVGLATPPNAAAEAPTEAHVQAIAESYGLACEEREFFEGEMRDIQCRRDAGANGEPPTVTVTYAPPGSPIVDIQVSVFGVPPLPADWNDIATDLATLGCDASREEVEAVMPADDGTGETERRQTVGTCGIDYMASDSGDGYVDWRLTIYLELEPVPTARPTSSPIPMPSPIPPPDDWSTGGRSTYSGTWTVTSVSSDGVPYEANESLGSALPGSLVVDCRGAEETCVVGAPNAVADLNADVLRDGALRGVREWEHEITMEECPIDTAVTTTTVDVEYDARHATATSDEVTDPGSCTVGDSSWHAIDRTLVFDGVLTAYEPPETAAAPDGEEAATDGTDTDGMATGPVASEPGPAPGDQPFALSVPRPNDVSADPIVLLQSALLAALLVFLMPFPSQLFNSTLETHEDEVRRWFRLDRLGAVAGGIGAFWSSWPGVAIFTLLAALLYGFLDPGFTLDLGSLATFLGMLLGIVLVTVAFALPAILAHRRHGQRPSLKVVPVSLLIGVACVVLSRITSFQPGYLYGLLIGLAFARELSAAEEGRATAIGAGLMLLVAFASWLGLGVLPESEAFGLAVARTALAALMVAGLEGVVFGLLPMRFLPGETLYTWNRVLWGGLLLIGAFAFFHILINPASGYLSDTSRTPLLTVIGLLVGFSLVSVAFWAWFRFRPAPNQEPGSGTSQVQP